MFPTPYSRINAPKGTALRVKGGPSAKVSHLLPPLKGLSHQAKTTETDPLLASILTNWIVEEDRISVRPGRKTVMQLAGATPISALVPYHGFPERLGAASGPNIYDIAGNPISSGYLSDDWHWTSFSNLSDVDYTIMVNGKDGVVSWDGASVADGSPVSVVSISVADPAVVTVAAADIGQFHEGGSVRIAGATGDFAFINGTQLIGPVTGTTFELPLIDTSAILTTSGTGITAFAYGSFIRENVTAPPGETWIVPDNFDKTLSHMNRLWFADSTNLAVYYLDLQQKSGELSFLPFNAIFKRGGHIVAFYTWTFDGGMGLDDKLCVFTSNGECAIYSGVDPDTDFQLVGVYRFDAPMSKHSILNYGGELYVLIGTGLVPMSTLLRAETEKLGKGDINVFSEFKNLTRLGRDEFGFSVILDNHHNLAVCNLPIGGGKYVQMVRRMPSQIWVKLEDIPARCWGWFDDDLYIGTDDGRVCRMSKEYLNDDGAPINCDVRMAWSTYKSVGVKQFKMVRLYAITDGNPRPFVDVEVDYQEIAPTNQPDVTQGDPGAEWNLAEWNVDYWAQTPKQRQNWNGVAALGRVGAVRIRLAITNCQYSLTGLDVIYETGSVM